jgi:hypothetical protein
LSGEPPPPPPSGVPAAPDRAARLKAIADEREYLEGLLNTRFNYYLVFASIVLLAALGSGDIPAATRAAILASGSLVSVPIAYSVGRTRHLLQVMLDELGSEGSNHPYQVARKTLETGFYRYNANGAIELVVWLLTLLFLAAAAYVATCGLPGRDEQRTPAMRIEIQSRQP